MRDQRWRSETGQPDSFPGRSKSVHRPNMDAVEINTSGPPQGEDAIASVVKICRVCLLGNLIMRDLFVENEVSSLSAKAMSFTNVKVRHAIWRLSADAELAVDLLLLILYSSSLLSRMIKLIGLLNLYVLALPAFNTLAATIKLL